VRSKQLCAATPGGSRRRVVVVRLLGDQRLRRQDQAGDGGSIANRAVADLDRVYDAGLDEVDSCAIACIEPMTILGLCRPCYFCFGVQACIGGNVEKWTGQRALKQLRSLLGAAI